IDLAFPGGDRVLKKELEFAIHEASARNFMFARGSGGRGGRGQGGGGAFGSQEGPQRLNPNAVSSDSGDFSPESDSSAGGSAPRTNSYASGSMSSGDSQQGKPQAKKPLPVLSAKSLDQQGLKNGFAQARDQRFSNAMGGFQPPPSSTGQSYGPNGASNNLQTDALSDFLKGKTAADMDGDGMGGDGIGGADSDTAIYASPGSETMAANESGQTGESTTGESSGQSSQTSQSQASSQSQTSSQPQASGQPPSSGGNAASPSVSATASQPPPNAPNASSTGQSGAPPQDQAPPSDTPSMPTMQMPTQNTVRREGRDWAMPEAFRGMGGTEVVRPISLICHHDRYELIDQGRLAATFPFVSGNVYKPTMELATAIRDRVATWGTTLPGGRWSPRLEVQVGPHGEQRFHELKTLMQGSGIEIHRRSP
ncbi:unnamed protein product, partial [Hapterophycus canaliculatus]